MLIKICNKCKRRIKQGESCECQKQRHKIYNVEHRDKNQNAFYQSKAWAKATALSKNRANGLDEYALHVEHRIVKGELTHHIFTIDEKPELRLHPDNLIYVSRRSHSKIHAAYSEGGMFKREMQRELLKIRYRGVVKKVDTVPVKSARF